LGLFEQFGKRSGFSRHLASSLVGRTEFGAVHDLDVGRPTVLRKFRGGASHWSRPRQIPNVSKARWLSLQKKTLTSL